MSVLTKTVVLWLSFIAVHVWLIWLGMVVSPASLGDISGVYTYWMNALQSGEFIVGVTTSWVYPLLAIVPMWLASLGGMHNYVLSWLILVTLVDIVVFAILIRPVPTARVRSLAAWWWILALLALGPVSLGRIDSVVTPLAILALLFLSTRPALAGAFMAIGAWMKVWPGAIFIAAIILVRQRVRVIVGALVVSASVVIVGLLAGAGTNLVSFLQFQGSRGLQIESPGATGYLWAIALGDPAVSIYFDGEMLTYQINGPGTSVVAGVMTWLMAAAIIVTLVAALWRSRRAANPVLYVPSVSLALVMALIAFNKVGSPQYFCWLIPPILLGLIVDRVRFIPVTVIGLATLLVTQIVYPWMYDEVLLATPISVFWLTVRNLLEFVLFAWALKLVLSTQEDSTAKA